MEQSTDKVKKHSFLQEFKLLLQQSGNLLCTCSACKAFMFNFIQCMYINVFNLFVGVY